MKTMGKLSFPQHKVKLQSVGVFFILTIRKCGIKKAANDGHIVNYLRLFLVLSKVELIDYKGKCHYN